MDFLSRRILRTFNYAKGSFSSGSSFLEGDLREGQVSESLRTPLLASSDLLDEPVSGEEGGEEEEEEF